MIYAYSESCCLLWIQATITLRTIAVEYYVCVAINVQCATHVHSVHS
jgi:hypothetical protein